MSNSIKPVVGMRMVYPKPKFPYVAFFDIIAVHKDTIEIRWADGSTDITNTDLEIDLLEGGGRIEYPTPVLLAALKKHL